MYLNKNKTNFSNINRENIIRRPIMSKCYPKNSIATGILWLILILLFNFAWDSGYSPAQAVETVSLPAQSVAPGEAALTVNLELPAGCKLNQEAPSTLGLKSNDVNVVAVEQKYAQNLPLAHLPLTLRYR